MFRREIFVSVSYEPVTVNIKYMADEDFSVKGGVVYATPPEGIHRLL